MTPRGPWQGAVRRYARRIRADRDGVAPGDTGDGEDVDEQELRARVTPNATANLSRRIMSIRHGWSPAAGLRLMCTATGSVPSASREREQRIARSAPPALQPLTVRTTRPRAPLLGAVDVRIDLARTARHAHQTPGGRLGGHRLAPAFGESLRCHRRSVGRGERQPATVGTQVEWCPPAPRVPRTGLDVSPAARLNA